MTDIPELMTHDEKMRIRAAAFQATRKYPGPVGEILSRELIIWEEFGYRLGGRQLINRLVDDIMGVQGAEIQSEEEVMKSA